MSGAMHFRLLDLPSELRNHIYEYALSEVVSVARTTPRNTNSYLHTPSPGLPLVNKQLYRETVGIYWSRSIFEVTQTFELPYWLAAMPADRRASLGAVRHKISRCTCCVHDESMRPQERRDRWWYLKSVLGAKGAVLRPDRFLVGYEDDAEEDYVHSVLRSQTCYGEE